MFGLEHLLKIMDPASIIVDHQLCLRARHRRSPCRGCSEACPTEAIGYENGRLTIDATACTRCGLCVGACPTDALQLRSITAKGLEGATRLKCAHADGEGPELPCLGWLTRDDIIDVGSRCPGLELAAGDCETCSLAAGGNRAKEAVTAASSMLAALGVAQDPVWVVSPKGATRPDERVVSRRELFSLWSRSAVQTGRTLLPDRDVNPVKLPTKLPARRTRWIKRFAHKDSSAALDWPLRTVNQGCIGCDICVAFCPTGALSSAESEGVWSLRFQATACVDCGTCIHLCPRRVLAASDERPTVGEVLSGTRRDLASLPSSERPQAGGGRPKW